MKKEDVLYKGTVNFSHSLIWIGVLCVTFGSIYFALPPLIEYFGGDFVFPSIVNMSAISFAIGISLPILLLVISLKIQVRKDGIYLKIIPFQLSYRKIPWDGLVNYEPYQAGPKEQNKLGIKDTIAGRSYALGGRRAIKLEFVNGKMVFIESRRPEKIIETIKGIKNNN
jgi:Family of unknown function (DUF6141)